MTASRQSGKHIHSGSITPVESSAPVTRSALQTRDTLPYRHLPGGAVESPHKEHRVIGPDHHKSAYK